MHPGEACGGAHRANDAEQRRLDVGLGHDHLDVGEGDGSTVTVRSEFMTAFIAANTWTTRLR